MRKQLMILANALRKTGMSLSDALKRAWAAIRIKTEMYLRPTTFRYVKDNGEERRATGYYGSVPEPIGNGKPTGPLVIKYFDLHADGWRSFRADRLILDVCKA